MRTLAAGELIIGGRTIRAGVENARRGFNRDVSGTDRTPASMVGQRRERQPPGLRSKWHISSTIQSSSWPEVDAIDEGNRGHRANVCNAGSGVIVDDQTLAAARHLVKVRCAVISSPSYVVVMAILLSS